MTVTSEGRGQVPEMTPCGDTEKSPRWDLTGTPRNRTTPTPSPASHALQRPPKPDHFWPRQEVHASRLRCGAGADAATPADGGSSACRQQGQTPPGITEREGLRPHRGSGRALGTRGGCAHPTPSHARPCLAGSWAFLATEAYCVWQHVARRWETARRENTKPRPTFPWWEL